MEVFKNGFFLILCAIFLSCHSSYHEDQTGADYHVKKDIGLTSDGKDLNSKFINNLNKGLGLSYLGRGYDSIQIRVWHFYRGYRTNGDLITLKNKNNEWYGVYYQFATASSEGSDSSVVSKKVEREVRPSNWERFIQKLFDNDIKTLPDHFKLGDSYGTEETHPGSIIVEYADKNIYRLYKYYSPESAYGDSKEAQKIETILTTIKNELNIPEQGMQEYEDK